MTAEERILAGRGLHTGEPCRVTLRSAPGPVRVRLKGQSQVVAELALAEAARSTAVLAGAARVGTVEHLFAALAGAGIVAGLEIEVDGPELPLLDGGALAWCEALGAWPGQARGGRRVVRGGTVEIGASRYAFAPAEGVHVAVTIDYPDARLAPDARWDGDRADFATRIAPARTFAFAHEVETLLAGGLARHVDPTSVVVVTPDAILSAGLPFAADEPARHKLLDLLGDLYLHGGPFVGEIHGFRPGHAATHAAVAEATRRGLLA